MATAETAPPARLKIRYLEEIRPALISRFAYSSVMQAPKIEKVTVNMGVGMARQDNKMLKAATEQLATIAGQQPSVRRARKSIAAFKLREGMPVGVAVTLRGDRCYEFLDRLISIAIPRIRDFRGLNPRSFDGRGNYSMGVKEQIIFPEIDYDAIDQVRGLDITITTSAGSDIEAYALLAALGMPFTAQGRPKGYDPEADAAAERAHEEAQQQADAKAAAVAAEAEAAKAAPPDPEPAEPEPAAEAEPEPAAEPEAEAPPEAEASSEPEAAADPEPTAEPDAGAPPEAEASSEPEPEATADPEAAAEPEAPAAEASTGPETATDDEPAAESEPDTTDTTEQPAETDEAENTDKENTD